MISGARAGSFRKMSAIVTETSGAVPKIIETRDEPESRIASVTSFVLPGMVKLVVQKRKARMGRNPATGEAIKIPAKTVVKARIAKQLGVTANTVQARLKEAGVPMRDTHGRPR